MRAAQLYQRKWLLIKLPIALLAAAAMALLWTRWMPLPPTELTLSAGQPDGAYYAAAQRYAEKFAEYGVTLRVLPSEGAVQNLQRLRGTTAPRADLAFVQGGVGEPADRDRASRVLTIARVDVEPLWIFSRVPGIDSLQQLQGLRVALGPKGSGTRKVGLALLEQVRLKPTDVIDSDLGGMQAANALLRGTVDVAVIVMASQAPAVAALMQAPGVSLVQLGRSAALTERLPFLQPALLPQGSLGPGNRLPARDTTLLVTTASLVARADLHPALQRLAAQVARDVHGRAGLFHRAGDFPSLKRIEFPASGEARYTLVHGLPWWEELLPFWWGELLLRLLVICLPIALAAVWLARALPAYLRWLVESRVVRWYGELKFIEHDLASETVSGLDMTKYLGRLNAIEKRMDVAVMPAYLMPRWFALRNHIDFVRTSLFRKRGR